MKNIIPLFIIGLYTMTACTQQAKKENPAVQVYEETWESLAKNEKEPDWFKDAKFGIYFHWGVYSVPAFDNEWYPRWMYVPDRGDNWGGQVYAYHEKTYGPVSEFNYHDFIPMFKAEHFDAENWATLFKNAGARFAGPVAQHHDGFAMWASSVNPWNAKDMGPKKDILGDLFTELKKMDMYTIATFHHAKVLQRYALDTANWAGQGPNVGGNSHFPYHPDYITSTTDPKLRLLYGNIPLEDGPDYWLDQIKEVIDDYAPDIIWFDSWLDQMPENYLQKMVAHQFNTGVSRGQEPLVACKQEDLPANISILDIEQGGKTEISEDYWLTDITLSHHSWSYTNGQTYKEPSMVVRNMIDVWSKKGVVLLNISPRADGVIVDEQRVVLNAIGEWIRKHEEAVYGTRTHSVYGYGIADFEEGHFGGQSATMDYGKDDIRFTRSKDNKTLYIYSLGLPDADADLELHHIIDPEIKQKIKRVSVVGSGAKLKWSVKENKLVLTTPATSEMDEIATVFKVEFKK